MLGQTFDTDLHAYLKTNSLSVPVYKELQVPEFSTSTDRSGYIVWTDVNPHKFYNSDGNSSDNTERTTLLVECVHSLDSIRKEIAESVLALLSPSGKPLVNEVLSNSIILNCVRRSHELLGELKTGQGQVERPSLVLRFSLVMRDT